MSIRDHTLPKRNSWGLFHVVLILLSIGITSSSLGRSVEITLVHTTDLHGHIWPTTDYEGNGDLGGILRCASKIETIRTEKENVLLVDCGDSYQGSPESYLSQGRLVVDAFNTLNYDAWVLGNHEFDWGSAVLRDRHEQASIPFLAANLYFMKESDNWLPQIDPFIIRNINGVRVVIIGLVTPGIPRWSRPNLLDNALFKRSVETLEQLWPDVMAAEPDIIILGTHQGYKNRGDDFANEIEAIAQAFPEIDVILGGHSHKPVHEMFFGDVLFSQAGYHGIWLGQVDLIYDTVTKKLTNRSADLHLMDSSIPFHQGLLEKWKPTLDQAEAELTNIVGYIKETLSSKPDDYGVSSMQQFLCQAISRKVDADFVLHGSLSEGEIPQGEISYRDVWKIVPYENTIGVLSMTPAQIRSVLEENHSRRMYHYSLGPFGFNFELVDESGVARVRKLRDQNGKALHARKKYRVAFNSYVLASGGERHMTVRRIADTPESRLEMLTVDTRSAVVELLQQDMHERDTIENDAK